MASRREQRAEIIEEQLILAMVEYRKHTDKQIAEVLGSLYAAFSGEQKPETQSPHWYRGYLTAINDVAKILCNKDLEKSHG